MARPKAKNLTEAEQRIMNVLWDIGEATVRDIADQLSAEYNLAYTTVLTTTKILEKKGYLSFRKEGRQHVFTPLVSKNDARSNALKSMLGSLFDGSPRLLTQHLIETDKLSTEDIAALRALLDANDKKEQS